MFLSQTIRLKTWKSLVYFWTNILLLLNPEGQRINLGLAQGYSVFATKTSFYHAKLKRYSLGEKANKYLEKAIYTSDSLSKTQIHSNAIAYFGKAINIRNNIRDDKEALTACEMGLKYEPENRKLIELQEQLKYKIEPRKTVIDSFADKGWKVKK